MLPLRTLSGITEEDAHLLWIAPCDTCQLLIGIGVVVIEDVDAGDAADFLGGVGQFLLQQIAVETVLIMERADEFDKLQTAVLRRTYDGDDALATRRAVKMQNKTMEVSTR